MSLIEINKTDVQVQMTINDQQITSLEAILDNLREVASELISGWIKTQQVQKLSRLIGAPWKPLPDS